MLTAAPCTRIVYLFVSWRTRSLSRAVLFPLCPDKDHHTGSDTIRILLIISFDHVFSLFVRDLGVINDTIVKLLWKYTNAQIVMQTLVVSQSRSTVRYTGQ